MNSMISCSRLLAATLCGLVLAGCDSIKDVKEEPFAELPDQTATLGGTIRDLGTRRPLILQYDGTDSCLEPVAPNDPTGPKALAECRFYGVADQQFSTFNFGALPVGTPYNITIKRQPFGKICAVTNPAGTVGQDSGSIQIACQDDPALPHYTVTANIAAAASSRPGLKVVLTTENGTCPVDATGLTTVTFSAANCPNTSTAYHQNAHYVFNSGTNLPIFGWRVTATIPGATDLAPQTNCFVTGGPVTNTGGNIDDENKATAAPTGNVSVNVVSCGFTVRAQADYSTPTTVPPISGAVTAPAIPAMPAGQAVTVLLREQPSGIDVAGVRITSFANTYVPFMQLDPQGEPTTTQYDARSDLNAFYEVVVKSSPAGMTCIPGSSAFSGSTPIANNGSRTAGHWTDAGSVLLRKPASARVAQLWVVDRVIRCRAAPAADRQLQGVYQQSAKTTTESRQGTDASTIQVTSINTVHNHNFLALFADGSYLYGNHTATASSNGVEHGFYDYDPLAATITFHAFTDTNGSSGLHAVNASGSTAGAPIPKRITGVQVSSVAGRNTITANFNPTGAFGTANTEGVSTRTTVDWIMSEVGADPQVSTLNPVDGAWVTWDTRYQVPDPRRIFVYQHGLYNAFHMGVNGVGNLQEACFVGNFALASTWTRQGARSGCQMRIYTERAGQPPLDFTACTSSATLNSCSLLSSGSSDIPVPTAELNDYPGRWPQSRNPAFTDGRPYSVVDYEVRLAGTAPSDPICPDADKLTVWDTLNGVRRDELSPPVPPIVLCRITAN
jgi:hypothetical protein